MRKPIALSAVRRAPKGAALQAVILALATSLVLGTVATLPATAHAQANAPAAGSVQEYAIPAGRLSDVLSAFAGQSGINLSFPPSLTEGQHSQGLQGRHTLQQGFSRLLDGTGLGLVQQPDGVTYTLRRLPAPSERVSSLQPVRVQGQQQAFKDLPYRTASSVTTKTRDDIERFRGTSVGDIFQGIPGVLNAENRNSGGLDVNIRGMQGQGRVPVLVDGARQETTVYRGYAGVASRSYIDPDLIGGMRIDKGPTMDAAGTGATGGLVSMSTLTADDIVRPGQTMGVRMRVTAIGNNSGSPAEAGSRSGYGLERTYRTNCISARLCEGGNSLSNVYGPDESMDRPSTFRPKSWAGSMAVAKRLESVDLIAAYAQRQQGNYYAGKHGPAPTLDLSERYNRGFWVDVMPKVEGASRFRAEERIVNSNFENKSLLLKSRLYLPADQELEFSYLRYHSIYGELMPSQLIWLGNVHQTDNSEVTAQTYATRYHWNPAENDWIDLRINAWHTRTRSLNQNYSDGASIRNIQDESELYRRSGIDLSNTMEFQALGTTQVRYGLAFQKEDVSSHVETVHTPNAPGMTDSTLFGRVGKREEFSMFAALQWKPVPSLTLDAGLRYTRFRSEDAKPVPVHQGSAYCTALNRDGTCQSLMADPQRGSGSAPMVSLAWEPLDGLQFYARYMEALRMPSLFESTSGNSVSIGLDTRLKPEHTTNREVGVNYLANGVLASQDKLRLKLAYFSNHTRDYLTRTLPNTWEDTSTGLNATSFRMRNIDSVSFNGMELSGSYDLGAVFMEFGGTRYNRIETCHTGIRRHEACTDYGIGSSYINNMIPPKWHASLVLGTRLLEQRLTLGMRGTFMGKRNAVPEYDDQGVSGIFAPPVPWHAYRIFDLFASYQVNDRLRFDFNIDNITDRYYLDALSLGLVPAPGRTARLSMTLQF